LGGRIDGTNVVTRHDKICVITNIGLDHTKILGTTIPAIAREKAGIILEGNEVFTHQQTEEALIVFEEVCASKHAELIIVPEQFMSETRDLPMFQQHNMGLAVACVRSVLDRGDRQLESAHIVKAAKTYVPARMERVIYRGKQLIIDGSHNGQKIQTLMESLTDAYPNASIAALVAFVAGDESRTKSGVKELVANASFIVVTEFTANQDVPKEAVPAPQVAAWCKEFGLDNVAVETEALRALDMLLERSEDILIVTGSFYLLNHIRPHIMKS
jgi:dihydrofolate synthase/folylpolyglutamate synthase